MSLLRSNRSRESSQRAGLSTRGFLPHSVLDVGIQRQPAGSFSLKKTIAAVCGAFLDKSHIDKSRKTLARPVAPMRFEALEPRILLSADLLPAAARLQDAVAPGSAVASDATERSNDDLQSAPQLHSTARRATTC